MPHSSHKRAIKMLTCALKDNPTNIQTGMIYIEIGFRYSEMGKIELAIENNTKSIEGGKLSDPLFTFGLENFTTIIKESGIKHYKILSKP